MYIPATCHKGSRAVGLARYWGMKLLKAARCSFSCRTHGGSNMNKIVGNKLFHRQRGRLNNRVLRREQHSHMIFTLFSQHSFVRFCVKLFFSAIGANSCPCVFYTGTSYFPLYCSVCLLDFIGFDNFFFFLSTSNLVQIQNKIFGFVFNLLWKTTVGFNYNYYQVCGKIRYYYLTKCFSKSRETEKRIGTGTKKFFVVFLSLLFLLLLSLYFRLRFNFCFFTSSIRIRILQADLSGSRKPFHDALQCRFG